MKKIVLSVFIVSLFTNAFAQDIEIFCIYPPEKYLNDVSKITVLDFSGDKGKEIATQITNLLLQEDFGIYNTAGSLFSSAKEGITFQGFIKTNIFTVVERSQLDKVLAEQNFSNTGLIDDNQATQIGALMGLDAIITGSVKITTKDEEKTNTYKDSNGISRKEYCTKRYVTTTVSMKILDVNTGQILGNKIVEFTATDNKCDKERSNLKSVSVLADDCILVNAVQLMYYFNPFFVKYKFTFQKNSNKEFKTKTKEAENYLKNNDFESAFSIFKSIYDEDPYNSKMAVNLGGIYFIFGDFQNALKYYKIGLELEPSNKDYLSSVKTTEKLLELSEFYAKHDRPFEFKNLEAKDDALSNIVTTKGRKSDRIDVKASKGATSETVARVPGSTQFTVIEQDAEWILIKLLGGDQGYINVKDIK